MLRGKVLHHHPQYGGEHHIKISSNCIVVIFRMMPKMGEFTFISYYIQEHLVLCMLSVCSAHAAVIKYATPQMGRESWKVSGFLTSVHPAEPPVTLVINGTGHFSSHSASLVFFFRLFFPPLSLSLSFPSLCMCTLSYIRLILVSRWISSHFCDYTFFFLLSSLVFLIEIFFFSFTWKSVSLWPPDPIRNDPRGCSLGDPKPTLQPFTVLYLFRIITAASYSPPAYYCEPKWTN